MPTFDGRRPSMEDNRQPLMEDDLHWKTTFDGRRTSIEDDLRWKTTFEGRQILMEDYLHWKKTCYKEISRLRSAIYRRCSKFFLGPESSYLKRDFMFLSLTYIFILIFDVCAEKYYINTTHTCIIRVKNFSQLRILFASTANKTL